MKQKPALIGMERAPDHANHLKIAISLSSLSCSTDQFKKAVRPVAQYPPWNTRGKPGNFLDPCYLKRAWGPSVRSANSPSARKKQNCWISVKQQTVSRFPVELSIHWLFWIHSRTKHNPLVIHQPPHLSRHMLIMSSLRAASASGPITAPGFKGKRATADNGELIWVIQHTSFPWVSSSGKMPTEKRLNKGFTQTIIQVTVKPNALLKLSAPAFYQSQKQLLRVPEDRAYVSWELLAPA